MGGNQSSKSSIYPTGFHKALYKHLQSYKKKTNNNNEQYEEAIDKYKEAIKALGEDSNDSNLGKYLYNIGVFLT